MGFSVFPESGGAAASSSLPTFKTQVTSSTTNLTYPAGTSLVYAVLIAGGTGGPGNGGPNAQAAGGKIAFGYVPPSARATIGAGSAKGANGYNYFFYNSNYDSYDQGYAPGVYGSAGGSTIYSSLVATGTADAGYSADRPDGNSFSLVGFNTGLGIGGNVGQSGTNGSLILMY
jgi:hypothetical protein